MIYDNLDIDFKFEDTTIKICKISNEIIDHPYPLHNHGKHCFEFHFVSCGTGRAQINDEVHPLTPNTFYITGPLISHAQFSDATSSNDIGNSTCLCEYGVYFKFTSPVNNKHEELLNILRSYPFWIGTNHPVFRTLFEKIFHELKFQRIGYTENIISLLRYMIVVTIRILAGDKRKALPLHSSTLDSKKHLLIDDTFIKYYKDITLTDLSTILGLSPRQTERLLKAEYGKTFLQKKLEARMSAAQILLANKILSITYISDYLGYSSIEHFSCAFRKFYGFTATEYRKNLR